MRLYPPCPFLARYCSEDTIIGENISVEQGTVVMWFNTYFHMHPDLYDNPKGSSLPFKSVFVSENGRSSKISSHIFVRKSRFLENFNSEKILIHLDGREMNPTLSKMTFGLGLVMVQELVRGHVGLILQ